MEKQVNIERKIKSEAIISRIMKGRRIMKHNELIQDSYKLIKASYKFDPSALFLKECIASLIDRDIIKRQKDVSSYEYVP